MVGRTSVREKFYSLPEYLVVLCMDNGRVQAWGPGVNEDLFLFLFLVVLEGGDLISGRLHALMELEQVQERKLLPVSFGIG